MTHVPASSHGGGNTSAQVAASGLVVPVADSASVTVDTTTYADTAKGGGAKLTTLVFPSDQGSLAIAIAGDAFPRIVMTADPTDYAALLWADGTISPFSANAGQLGYFSGGQRPSIYGAQGVDVAPALRNSQAPQLQQLSPAGTINSGALPTVALVSGTGAQILTSRDAETVTPITFNPGAATTATCTVALSPDNVTYSTLGVETEPAGVAFDGTIHLIKVRVPAGWYLKLTVNAQAVLGTTTYY